MDINFRRDIIAGFSVFLLALPLCLGIAFASHFPPVAGIISAIVGGLLGSWWGGARLSIKGPAAGLIVIAVSAVSELGYEHTLAVGVVSALIQIFLGFSKKAIIAEVMSPSIIHGMLVAIGIIILSQQLYVMMGLSPAGEDTIHLLLNLPGALVHSQPLILSLGLLSLFIAISWPMIKKISFIPSTLVILLICVPLSWLLHLDPHFLISIPKNLLGALTFPDFTEIYTLKSLKYIMMFTLIGSIESLLTVCAINTLVSDKPPSDLNKDMVAVGVGNLASAFLGGLPMISEIVRSKANIDYGASSMFSNFFHGLFMLVAVLIFPTVINLIPLSALAALLVFVGYRLASPKEFVHVYKIGKDQFLLFSVTLIVTLMSDLLMGVVSGLVVKILLHIIRSHDIVKLFRLKVSILENDQRAEICLQGPITFLNYLRVISLINKLRTRANHIVIDLSAVTFIDHTVLNKLEYLARSSQTTKIDIKESEKLIHCSNHPLSTSSQMTESSH